MRAVRVPYTYPRYVTSVTRLNSPGSISVNGANTEVNATLTQTSTGEGRRGRHCGGFDLCAVDDVSGQREGASAWPFHLRRGGVQTGRRQVERADHWHARRRPAPLLRSRGRDPRHLPARAHPHPQAPPAQRAREPHLGTRRGEVVRGEGTQGQGCRVRSSCWPPPGFDTSKISWWPFIYAGISQKPEQTPGAGRTRTPHPWTQPGSQPH